MGSAVLLVVLALVVLALALVALILHLSKQPDFMRQSDYLPDDGLPYSPRGRVWSEEERERHRMDRRRERARERLSEIDDGE